MRSVKRSLALCAVGALAAAAAARIGHVHQPAAKTLPGSRTQDGGLVLPSGWKLTPAGRHISLAGDMPLGLVFSPDGRNLLVSTAGFHDHGLAVIDAATEKVTDTVSLYRAWNGLAISADGKDVYVASGQFPRPDYKATLVTQVATSQMIDQLTTPVHHLTASGGKLALAAGVPVRGMGEGRYTAGVAIGPNGSLYVLDINHDTVYHVNRTTGQTVAQQATGYRPYAIAVSADGKEVAVANWGGGSVMLLDPATLEVKSTIEVGSHPNALLYARDGSLFVACGGENRVAVIRGGAVVESINTALEPKSPIGTTPDALAISPDQSVLFVACADINAVATVALNKHGASKVSGFIPTGWYPSALTVSPDGKRLYVGTGKGLNFRSNFPGLGHDQETTDDGKNKYDYIGNVLNGTVSVVDMPNAKQRDAYTAQVRKNGPGKGVVSASPEQEKRAKSAFSHIKHVVYIIRENRTYDQVFGDIQGANGEPKLTMYGEQVTPNAHALARRTTLLDNLYCSGEVSEDGHQWCNAAYVTDFKTRAWIASYSDHGEPDADERLSTSPAGYLWDNCGKHGKTYRAYGEAASFKSTPTTAPVFTGPAALKGHSSEAWYLASKKPDVRDYERIDAFIQELHDAEHTGKWPNYMVMSLGEDHTHGLSAGAYSPFACVASNDLALGKLVEAVSHSKFWKETAIFVIEDDAQDGPDHVDAHRTAGLVISPYTRRAAVDSTLYTTAGMIRTMEMILSLPPMTIHDKLATPMYGCFTSEPDFSPYIAITPKVNLMAKNAKAGEPARISATLDFKGYDRADPAILNKLLWEDAHPGTPVPASVRSGVLTR